MVVASCMVLNKTILLPTLWSIKSWDFEASTKSLPLYKIRLGSAVDETLLDTPEQYNINGVSPSVVHRFSEAEATLPGLNGVYPFAVRLQHHDLYLEFDSPPVTGESGTVEVDSFAVGGRTSLQFNDSDSIIINPHIHVNQEGYFPTVPNKRMLFGAWLGSAGHLLLEGSTTCEPSKIRQ